MSEAERARLREVAEAATPGPWWLATDGEPWSGDQAMTVDLDTRAAAGEVVDEEWDAWHATGTGSLFCGDVHYAPDGVFVATFDPPTVLALLDALASRDARLAAVEAMIETLPRNEFGDEHYLAVDAAYGNVVTQLRAALHPDPSEATT